MGEVETVGVLQTDAIAELDGVAVTLSGGGTGVSARAAHLWKPGQSGNPSGRPRSNKLYKAELIKRFSPEELAEYWFDALRIARAKEDAGAMGRILKDISEQLMGKPVATSVTVKTKYEELLMLRLAAGEGAGGEDIDGEING